MDEEASENNDRGSDRADPDAAEQGDDDSSENDDDDDDSESESEFSDYSIDSDAPSQDQGRNNTGDRSEDLDHLSLEEQKEMLCRKIFNVLADKVQYIPKISGIDKQDLAVLIRIMVFTNQIRRLASLEEFLDWKYKINQEFLDWQYHNSLRWDNDSGRITSLKITAGSQSLPRFQQVDGAAAAPYNIVHEDIGRLDKLKSLSFFGKFHKVPFNQLGAIEVSSGFGHPSGYRSGRWH